MSDFRPLLRIQIAAIAAFIVNKALIRPFVLARDLPALLDIFVLSFSNFCEAIVGTVSVVLIGSFVNRRWVPPARRIARTPLHIGVILVAGVYVITQEFKLHNLGGRNVYDPYDVVFSVIGLAVSFVLLQRFAPGETASR